MVRRWASMTGTVLAAGLAAGFGYLSVTAGAPLTPAGPGPALPPTLAIEPAVLDLGATRQNQTLTGTATVVNRLPVAVDVVMVSKSCSCADAEVEPKHLEPGQAATLTLSWRTGSKRGPVSDRITVVARTVGEPVNQVGAELKLTADIRPDVVVEPAELTFTTGEAGVRTIRVRPGLFHGAALIQAYATPRGITAEADTGRGEVRVGYAPSNFDATQVEVAVMVETNAPNGRWVRVPIRIVAKR